jgi:hypothetical protein
MDRALLIWGYQAHFSFTKLASRHATCFYMRLFKLELKLTSRH